MQKVGIPFAGRDILCAVGGGILKHLLQLVFAFDINAGNPVQVIEADEFGINAVRRGIIFGRYLLD
ncbi:hypothetical protein D3C81_1968310 [compost metagenome]